MEDIILLVFGEGQNLNALQTATRATIVFLFSLFLIRIAGRRSFGLHAPLDNIVVILLGAIIARAVVGASPFFSTLFAGFVIALLHRAVAFIAVYSRDLGRMVKGNKIVLYKDGKFIKQNMMYTTVSLEDIQEEIRLQTNQNVLEGIEEVSIERNGKISIIKDHN
jgi:uncharacterized membrane protein YcaP (DUF421 family)